MELIKTVKELSQLTEALQKKIEAISARLEVIEDAINLDCLLADKELDPEVAEGNARTAAEEAEEAIHAGEEE